MILVNIQFSTRDIRTSRIAGVACLQRKSRCGDNLMAGTLLKPVTVVVDLTWAAHVCCASIINTVVPTVV